MHWFVAIPAAIVGSFGGSALSLLLGGLVDQEISMCATNEVCGPGVFALAGMIGLVPGSLGALIGGVRGTKTGRSWLGTGLGGLIGGSVAAMLAVVVLVVG